MFKYQYKKLLCNLLIQCHLDYALYSWYNGLSKEMKNKLQIVQNKCERFKHGYNF